MLNVVVEASGVRGFLASKVSGAKNTWCKSLWGAKQI